MKTTLVVTVSVIITMIMGLSSNVEVTDQYEDLIAESEALSDSAAYYLDEIHHYNDSVMDKYFPLDEKYNQGEE